MAELAPLSRNRDFVLLQTGQALSTVGSEASGIAYTLLVLALTHSPAKAGLTAFARLIPYALFALPFGVAVDRWNRKRLMIVSDLVRVCALGSLGIVIALGDVAFVQIPIVAFVEGTMFVLFNIAEIGAVRSVVAQPQLQRAFATEQARLSGVYLAGPPLGGFLFSLGRAVPFLVDAISYAFSTGTLLAMRTPFQEEREPHEAGIVTQVREGLAWLWQHAFLRTCALLFVGTNFAFGALDLTLIVAARRQGLGSAAIGLLLGVVGAVSLAGSLAAPRLLGMLSIRTAMIASIWLALGIAAFVVVPNVFVLVAGWLPFVFLNPTVNAMVIGYRVAIVPDRLQGRVNSVARALALLALPLGPVIAGLVLAAFSARTTVALIVVVFAVLAVATTASRAIRSAPSFVEATS